MRVVLVDFRFTYAIVLSLLWVSSSVIGRSNAASSLLNDPFYGISPQGHFYFLSINVSKFFTILTRGFVILLLSDYPDENYYKTSSNTIKCKDGSKKFAKTQLNDDYCDCPDGTDEPGFHSSLICLYVCNGIYSFYFSFSFFMKISS